MAVTILREKETATATSVRTPYFAIEQDESLLLDRDGARDAIIPQATSDAGLAPTDFAAKQLSSRAWRIEAIFSSSTPSKLTLEPIGNVEIGFRFQAEPELVKYSTNTVFRGGHNNTTYAPKFGNLVGIQGGQWGNNLKHTGIQISPRVTNWMRYTVANDTITQDYEKQIGDVMGDVNSATYRGKPAGTLRFVSCSSTIRSDADMQITFGFDYRPIVATQTINGLNADGTTNEMVIPPYDGHDLFWTYDEVYVETYSGPAPAPPRSEILSKQAMFWYIERVHPRSNFVAGLGI